MGSFRHCSALCCTAWSERAAKPRRPRAPIELRGFSPVFQRGIEEWNHDPGGGCPADKSLHSLPPPNFSETWMIHVEAPVSRATTWCGWALQLREAFQLMSVDWLMNTMAAFHP